MVRKGVSRKELLDLAVDGDEELHRLAIKQGTFTHATMGGVQEGVADRPRLVGGKTIQRCPYFASDAPAYHFLLRNHGLQLRPFVDSERLDAEFIAPRGIVVLPASLN